ncbi:MAG: folate-binding protein [Pseudomonadota bacterium]
MSADAPLIALPDRGFLTVTGSEATAFLQGLVTCDMRAVESGATGAAGAARYGAFLTPQGKVLHDFFICAKPGGGGFVLDVAASEHEAFAKRLTLYRLRRDVTIETLGDGWQVAVALPPLALEPLEPDLRAPGTVLEATDEQVRFVDPRGAGLGVRVYTSQPIAPFDDGPATYRTCRLRAGAAEAPGEVLPGTDFAHEVGLPEIGAVAYDKGCFLGQEILARMKHRSTARKRLLPFEGPATGLAADASIEAEGKTVGAFRDYRDGMGFALVRVDRLLKALEDGTPLLADGQPVQLTLPEGWTLAEPSRDHG